MSKVNSKDVEILNDLIEINNDRIAGYQKALENLKAQDRDLRNTFTDMIDQSHRNKMALASAVADMGDDPSNTTSFTGDLYRTWQDLKAAFTGHDRKGILENCEFGEDAMQNAYAKALDKEGLSSRVETIIRDQKVLLKASHNLIRQLRDA